MGHTGTAPRGFLGTFRQLWQGRGPAVAEDRRAWRAAVPPAGLDGRPLPERLRLAFEAVPLTDAEERAVGALLRRPGATSKVLSDACGWGGSVWHTHFAALCQKRAAWLWPAELPDEPDAWFLAGVLTEYDAQAGTFRMRPEVAAVFQRLGIR